MKTFKKGKAQLIKALGVKCSNPDCEEVATAYISGEPYCSHCFKQIAPFERRLMYAS